MRFRVIAIKGLVKGPQAAKAKGCKKQRDRGVGMKSKKTKNCSQPDDKERRTIPEENDLRGVLKCFGLMLPIGEQ